MIASHTQEAYWGAFIMKRLLLIAIAAFAFLGTNAARAVPVDLELALLVDVSGSVDSGEYNLQKTGYVDAFNDPTIQNLIAGLPGGIAVTYIEWASTAATVVNWTQVTDATSANAFATAIANEPREPYTSVGSSTIPSNAISYAYPLFGNNGFEGTRSVIDVSGDGTGSSTATAAARAAALANGIDAINGLPIGSSTIEAFYQNYIVGGTGSFLIAANSFSDFQSAVY
ncbi:MAG: DUF1194 domain-containing protein, partial [Acidihalobacter sp.]